MGADGLTDGPTKAWGPGTASVWDVDALKDSVKLKFPSKLKDTDAAELSVLDSESGEEGGEALKPGVLVENLKAGKDESNPLLVKAPPGEPRHTMHVCFVSWTECPPTLLI
jgi:hypothetical protein